MLSWDGTWHCTAQEGRRLLKSWMLLRKDGQQEDRIPYPLPQGTRDRGCGRGGLILLILGMASI